MIVVSNNWRMWAAGTAVSLVIFLIVFFVAIKPSTDTANNALKTGLKQSQQALNQTKSQLNNAASDATGAQKTQLSNAAKLTACVQAAGTDTSKLETCRVKFPG
jgi:hypothetical protein